MTQAQAGRRFWQIYTPRNVWREIRHRVGAWRTRDGARAPAMPAAAPAYDGRHAQEVGRFYDTHHDDFLRVYGDVIQAFRTHDVADLLDHQIRRIGLRPGERVLDAGCGVGAPAVHFATRAGVLVDAITISRAQHDATVRRVAAARLQDRIRVVQGDYHRLPEFFPAASYDAVYFLESFGHSRDKPHLIGICWEMLKPGGTLYIKDLFRRVPLRPEHAPAIDREIGRIDEAYRYEVGDLNAVLDSLRGRGFILDALTSIDLRLSDFEDLAISNTFQELTGIAPIQNWDAYIFPVDFFEVRAVKPEFPLDERLDRHHLQQRLHRRADATPHAAHDA